MLMLNQYGGFGSRGSVDNLLYIAINTVTTNTLIQVPTATEAGDLVICVQHQASGSSAVPTAVQPSGFSYVGAGTQGGAAGGSNGARLSMSYKVVQSGDLGVNFTCGTGAGYHQHHMIAFRPSRRIVSVETGGWDTSGPTENNPAALTIVAPTYRPSISFGVSQVQSSDPTPTGTITSTGTQVFTDTRRDVYYRIFNNLVTLEDLTIDVGDAGNMNHLCCGWVAVR